mmetsp:Transcript_21248/g.49001  ORF Transcript_21248/g.49001 Transcript_21248/m.49001 type:complete len:246 (+) Transcript_21248:132-869(+)
MIIHTDIVAVIKEELALWLNIILRKEPDSNVTVDINHFGVAIGLGAMVCKAGFVPLTRSVHHIVRAEIEQVAPVDLVIDSAPSLSLLLRNHLTNVLMNEIPLFESVPSIDSPPSILNTRFSQKQVTMPPHPYVVVTASLVRCWLVGGVRARPASAAQIWVTLPLCRKTRTRLCGALPIASTSTKEIATASLPHTMLCAKESVLDATTSLFRTLPLVIAGHKVGMDLSILHTFEPSRIVVAHRLVH